MVTWNAVNADINGNRLLMVKLNVLAVAAIILIKQTLVEKFQNGLIQMKINHSLIAA